MSAQLLPKPTLTLTFDDGHRSLHSIALPMMSAVGFTGAVAILSDRVGVDNYGDNPDDDYLTLAQMQEMYNAGWDMINHTDNHPRLSTLSPSQQIDAYENCKTFLIGNGYPADGASMLICPTNDYDSVVTTTLYNYDNNIVMSGKANDIVEKVGNRFHFNRLNTSNKSLAQIQTIVENVIANGGAGHCMYHAIGNADDYDWWTYPEVFEEHLSYYRSLVDAGTINIVNPLFFVNQYMRKSLLKITGSKS